MKLSDKLIELRKTKGWSQEDFAEKLDVSRQAISRWENGTALPDAQNILRITKLFNISADYLLNDDYEGERDFRSDKTDTEENMPTEQKKERPYLIWIAVIGLIILSACAIIAVVRSTNEGHSHPVLTRVIENEVAPTCTVEGSYDEVFYCTACGDEVWRTHVSMGMPAHQFENEKCIVCGEEQRARE